MSAGVKYFIIPNDAYKMKYKEVLVRKKTQLWQNDPQLHPFLDKMVKIKGDIIETRNTITVDCIEIEEIDRKKQFTPLKIIIFSYYAKLML